MYTVGFKNTGNHPAQDVVVVDRLDPLFYPMRFRLLSSSHGQPRFSWKEGREVQFRFDDIYLPNSIHDEPGSHGFLSFSIYPGNTAAIADTISNRAAIYFGFNPPVDTNTTTNILSNARLHVTLTEGDQFLEAYPNPSHGTITVMSSTEGIDKLFDMQGRCLQTLSLHAGKERRFRCCLTYRLEFTPCIPEPVKA